jgi:hypothetical protein
MNQTLYIPDLVGAAVAKVSTTFSSRPTNPFNVYYDFGHHEEVLKNLIYKEQDPTKPKKYPLIWLVTPFKEKRGGNTFNSIATLHFVIAHYTEMNYSMPERRDNVFMPILYPVYNELMRQLGKSGSFQMPFIPKHDYMDLQFAKVDTDGTNLFGDYVDVIDVRNFELIVKNICITS